MVQALQHSMASQRNLPGEAEISYRNIQVLAREEMNRMYRLEFVAAAAVRTAEKVQVRPQDHPPPTERHPQTR